MVIRGKPLWVIIFRAFSITIPALFGYLVYLASVSDEINRGIDAFLAMAMCCFIFALVHKSLSFRALSEALPFSLAIQFFFRGATVSIVLAIMLESFGMSTSRPRYVVWKDAPFALMVGFAEEVAKLLVVVVGTILIPSQLPESLVLEQGNATFLRCIPATCCVRSWTNLVESPRALAMTGISVGFGFMFSENLEYFFMVFTTMDTTTRLVTTFLRIILNLHPILTGICASRLANLVWKNSSVPKSISIGKLAQSIWPSVLMHALFDFGLMFTASNPDLTQQDTVFVIVSVGIIPLSLVILWQTYKGLPQTIG